MFALSIRRVTPKLSVRLLRMGRQQTLGKFFEMPQSVKPAPPQQANLSELWGKKQPKNTPADASVPDETAMEVDSEAPAEAETSKRKESAAADAESGPKVKRRRIVDSDAEDDELTASAKPSSASKPASSPESSPKAKGKKKATKVEDEVDASKGKGKAKAKASVKEDDEKAAKGKGKQKAKAPAKKEEEQKAANGKHKATAVTKKAKVEEEDEEMEGPAASADEGEDELDADDEIDSEDDTTGAASKIAEAALSRTADVDIKGGWKTGEPVPYAALTKTFALIEATTKRLEKTALLTSFLYLVIQRSADGDFKSLLQAVYLCINRLSPDYADLKKEGDLGLVAMNSKNSQRVLFKPKPLTLSFVFANLREIALTSGHSSQAKKVSIITKLLAACQEFEAKYIVRSLEGKLRIGNAERSVVVALAHAAVLAEKEKADKKWSPEKLAKRLEEGANIIKSVYSELPSYDEVIPALLKHGIQNLHEHCKLTPGVPLKPMLAKPTKAIGEVLDRFENKRFTCEYKYDGERAQVHRLADGTVGVFSRNSEDMSKKYPDLMEQLPRCIKDSTESFVLDCEAVAIDRATGKLMPFQELSRRKRKDVKVEDIQVRVCLFAFDLLYLNGEPLLKKTLQERRELLRKHFQVVAGEFDFAKSSDGETTDEIQAFLEQSVKDGCEGLMVKMLETDASYYEPSRRSINWLKLKKDYLAGVGDSLDLVVVGGYYGKGKRTDVYGAFLLACYDADSEQFQTICKIGTGFSEEVLQSHYDVLKPLELTKVRGDVKVGGAKPDVWFEPQVVWEVLTADLSLSPVYTAAQGLVEERGISLRFPRFVRIRDDKSAEDATGPEQIAEMYESQALAQSKGKKKKGDDDGFW
ncbi:DNA ligase [Mycena sanguinolenta]|uniref:DNA ligase n=1 Tax=Mycena sanguinolenta TaxID=230812 RepID=A0A8H6XFA7_9AGAR|nr:DNA ligase [Mycena sanguinolenta]